MKTNPLSTINQISLTLQASQLANRLQFTTEMIEEMLFNFPTIRQITTLFSDKHKRYWVYGSTDSGKRMGVIFFIQNNKAVITFINKM